jgi:hypothetical protein
MFKIKGKSRFGVETVDECNTEMEAKAMLREYVMAFGSSFTLWIEVVR